MVSTRLKIMRNRDAYRYFFVMSVCLHAMLPVIAVTGSSPTSIITDRASPSHVERIDRTHSLLLLYVHFRVTDLFLLGSAESQFHVSRVIEGHELLRHVATLDPALIEQY